MVTLASWQPAPRPGGQELRRAAPQTQLPHLTVTWGRERPSVSRIFHSSRKAGDSQFLSVLGYLAKITVQIKTKP